MEALHSTEDHLLSILPLPKSPQRKFLGSPSLAVLKYDFEDVMPLNLRYNDCNVGHIAILRQCTLAQCILQDIQTKQISLINLSGESCACLSSLHGHA